MDNINTDFFSFDLESNDINQKEDERNQKEDERNQKEDDINKIPDFIDFVPETNHIIETIDYVYTETIDYVYTETIDYVYTETIDYVYTETDINTEIELVTKKSKEVSVKDANKEKEKLKIKVRSDNINFVFTKVKDLYTYIKNNITKDENYYNFILIKNNHKIIVRMRSKKQILNYVLTYHVDYEIID